MNVVRACLAILLFATIPLSSETMELKEDRPVPSSYLLGEELQAEDLVTWFELEKLAAAENRIVLPDCGTAGLRDDIARWIPVSGLDLTLKPEHDRRVFIYFDFVGMIDQGLEPPANERRCIPSRKETIFDTSRRGPYEWLEVIVNGKRQAIFYQGHDVGFTGPVVVPVSREQFRGGYIQIRLVPSGRFFALWDVFLSHSPPEE